jgi:type III pantothenate kinase
MNKHTGSTHAPGQAGLTLLLDAGNTRVKLAWLAPGAEARAPGAAAFDYGDMAGLTQWVAGLPGAPRQALGASVVDRARMAQLESAVARASSQPLSVQWLSSQPHAARVRNDYAAGLGADRWAGMLGLAWRERRLNVAQRAPALLASFGTATTVDALLPVADDPRYDYAFAGGVILPGVALMTSSLAAGTARLPDEPGRLQAYPAQTRDAIATGVAAAQIGAVWRQWRELGSQGGHLYVTGGAWPLLQAEAGRWFDGVAIERLEAPVLDGLASLAAQVP